MFNRLAIFSRRLGSGSPQPVSPPGFRRVNTLARADSPSSNDTFRLAPRAQILNYRGCPRSAMGEHTAESVGETLRVHGSGTADAGAADDGWAGLYKLVRRLGAGGMGEVWLADQLDPFRRQVAIKFIRAGMDTREVVARFESEEQALALMDHPSIAHVYDAGTLPDGRPYFVMEYVPGIPITEFCDERHLGVGERLRLFSELCEGVQHAHQKAVIHRDLKPSNVLVAGETDGPQLRIIDFGIAKAIGGQQLGSTTLLTEVGGTLGTPAYMSPEQAYSGASVVDTRTDIFSLGVILYELLTGQRPFRATEGSLSPADEIRRQIIEVDPPRPSASIHPLPEAAQARKLDGNALARALRGDLDAIVLKALEKDRDRRYGTAAELAADLGRHLRHEPVIARPPRLTYRIGKYVSRHRLAVGLAIGIATAILAGATVALWQAAVAKQQARLAREQARVAQQQEKRARAIEGFLIDLFNANTDRQDDPLAARGLTALQLLDIGASRVQSRLKDEPEVQDEVLDTLAAMYSAIGSDTRAAEMERRRAELLGRIHGPDDPSVADALVGQARALQGTDRSADAPVLLRQARDIVERAPSTPVSTRADLLIELSRVSMYSDVLGSRDLARRARELVGRAGEGQLGLQVAFFQEGYAEERLGNCGNASELYRQSLAWSRDPKVGQPSSQVTALIQLASAARCLGDMPGAERMLREALALSMRVNGQQHVDTFHVETRLARLLHESGRRQESWEVHHSMLARIAQTPDATTPQLMRPVRRDWVASLLDEGRVEEAVAVAREEKTPPPKSRPFVVALALRTDAALAVAEGRATDALPLLAEAERLMTGLLGPDAPAAAMDDLRLERAAALLVAGRSSEALEAVQDVGTSTDPAAVLPVASLRAGLVRANALFRNGRREDSRAEARRVLSTLEASPLRSYFSAIEADGLLVLGKTECAGVDPDSGEKHLRAGLDILAAQQDAASPSLAQARLVLGHCLLEQGRRAEARVVARQVEAELKEHPHSKTFPWRRELDRIEAALERSSR